MKEDTSCVKLLVDIAYAYCSINPDEGLKHANHALSLAQKLSWRRGEALAINELGNNYQNKGEYPEALEQFFKALRIQEEAGAVGAAGKVSSNIGNVYYFRKNYPKALEYYTRSAAAADALNDTTGRLLASGNLGMVYYSMANYEKALSYMQHALQLAEQLDDRQGVIRQLNNISNIYSEQQDHTRALRYSFRALRIAEATGDRQMIAGIEGNIGLTYLDLAQDSSAAGQMAGRRANLDQAIKYLSLGIGLCREVRNNEALIELLPALSQARALLGDYQGALLAHQQYTLLKDTIHNIESSEKIAALETARAMELKDKDIQIARLAIAKKKNERWFYIAGIVVLLGVVAIVAAGYRRQQRHNTLLSSEKSRSDALLLNILPAEVAEELKKSGTSAARQYSEVSVLFTDFVNFTGASEMLDPQALVSELDTCFTAFDAIIEQAGLEKIKTIGDAYMAVCGLPITDSQHAFKTVEAALRILDFIEGRRKEHKGLDVRIGISSGPVVAGIVGSRKFAYDIWGDTVNTAARMEQCSEPGRINVSRATFELIRDRYACEYRGRIAAKNKGEVDMYFVTRLTRGLATAADTASQMQR